MRSTPLCFIPFILFAVVPPRDVQAQSESAMTRLRPLGSPSAVDQFRRPAPPPQAILPVNATIQRQSPVVRNETAYWQTPATVQATSAPIRQTVWMQSNGLEAPAFDGSSMELPTTPPNSALPPSGVGAPFPNSTPFPAPTLPPRSLPAPPSSSISSSSDLIPIPQPQLDTNNYARVENCNLVTPPSTYMAASTFGCGCGQVVPTGYASPVTDPITQAPGMMPAEIPSSATLPPVSVYPPPIAQPPSGFPNSAAPARALVSLGQEKYAVQVGQGLWGQPVAYVPGQGLRNWMRYIFP